VRAESWRSLHEAIGALADSARDPRLPQYRLNRVHHLHYHCDDVIPIITKMQLISNH
jgi:hypothetical protein